MSSEEVFNSWKISRIQLIFVCVKLQFQKNCARTLGVLCMLMWNKSVTVVLQKPNFYLAAVHL